MTAPAPNWTYWAALDHLEDGDTLTLNVDLGFRVHIITPVRLAGINAAEHGTPAGDAATEFVAAAIQSAGRITVVSAKPGKYGDKYGRWLATVWVGDRSLNADLVATGHAVVWDGRGPKPVPAWPIA